MATIESAKKKYVDKMAVAYKHYSPAMGDFFGKDVSDSAPVKNYEAKFDTDVKRRARADKWSDNLKAAFGLA